MEYQFVNDPITGFSISISSEHQLVGTWLIDELGQDKQHVGLFLERLNALCNLTHHEFTNHGKEIGLLIKDFEVTVISYASYCHTADIDHLTHEHIYLDDSGLKNECGLEDFIDLVRHWHAFLQ